MAADLAKRRAGVCRFRDRVIGLSAPLTRLDDEPEVVDTILHEIAHALAGPAAGHGPAWRAVAARVGCSSRRCLPADAPRVPGAWVGVCSRGHTTDRHRGPERLALLPVGARARVVAPGRFEGQVGTVVRRGRTSYHLRVAGGLLRVVFAGVRPV